MAGRPRTRIPLDLFVNARRAGQLRREASGAIDFRYAAEWLAWEHTFPISLSLPLREDRYVGEAVVAVFDNLLPDHHEIRSRLAARTGAGGTDAFSLLTAVGRDCVGALQFLPEGEASQPSRAVEGRVLDDAEVAAILGNLARFPLGATTAPEFRISLAGAQDKTALLWWRDAWHIPHGASPTTHILKPAIGGLSNGIDLSDSVENEYLCLALASAVGLPAPVASMATFGETRALVVERFDRQWTSSDRLLRLPQEDVCQALSVPPVNKYESEGGPDIARILALLNASDEPAHDQRLFLKAQIFFWLIGATDGHAKNFSLHLLPGGRFRLAPLYDIMSTQPYVDAGQLRRNQFKLAMAVGTRRHYVVDEVLPRHFVQTATAAGVGATFVNAILAELDEITPRALDEVSNSLPAGFPQALVDRLAAGVRRRLRTMS